MKLSPDELAEVARQIATIPPEQSRAAAGQPGGHDQPLSYTALLAERRALLGLTDG